MTVNIIKNFIKKMKEKGMREVKLMSEDDEDYYYFQMVNPLPGGGHSLVIMKEPKIAKGFDLEF